MDAACGPSNGIKSLQRHFDTDQSLHQSRIRQGHANPQFRNTPTQEQQLQASREQNSFLNASRSEEFIRPNHQIGLSNNNWSQDFQKSLPSIQARHQPLFAPQQASQASQGQWGAEFLASTTQQASISSQHQFMQNRFPDSGFMGHPSMMQFSPSQSMAPSIIQDTATTTTREDFDVAFAEAEASLQESSQATESTLRMAEERDLVGMTSDQMSAYNQEEEMRLARDMNGLETRAEVDARFEGDALADTAGELIHSLRDERSTKFKNSNFMALMHKLRDREVIVDAGKLVDAQTRREVNGQQTRDIDALVSERNQLQDVVFD